jgi:hypothetical protein
MASTTTNDWPRTGSGISGIGGKFMILPTDVIFSGMSAVHSAAEAGGAQEHGVGKRTERRWEVPGALGRDMLAIGRRRTDDIAHIIRALRHRNASRLRIDQQVECPAL